MYKQLTRHFIFAGFIILALGLASCLMAGCSGSSSSDPDENLVAQSEPANGTVLNGTSAGESAVEVTAAPGESAYVKVKSLSGGTVVGFYVRAGATSGAYVPAGTYSVQFATGETWYGTSDRFGSRTLYGQDENLTLDSGSIVTYKLQRSTSGNFSMDPLDGSNF